MGLKRDEERLLRYAPPIEELHFIAAGSPGD